MIEIRKIYYFMIIFKLQKSKFLPNIINLLYEAALKAIYKLNKLMKNKYKKITEITFFKVGYLILKIYIR